MSMLCVSHRIAEEHHNMHLDHRTRSHLETTSADKTAPAELRAACTDWLHRYQTGLELLRELSAAGRSAADQLQQAKRDAPRQLELMLATGHVTLEAVGAQLPDLRWALDIAQDRHAIARRTLDRISSQISSAPWRSCPDSILTWLASSMADQPRARLAPHQEHAWHQVAARWLVTWPVQSCELPAAPGAPAGTVLMLPIQTRLELPWHASSSQLAQRHRWLWERIAAGEFQTRPGTGQQLELTSTAPWR
jgi:hypothetical protein